MPKQDELVATLERDRPLEINDGALKIELLGDVKNVQVRITRPKLRVSSRRRDREQEEGE